jgi:probable HAF family extracellular repeat protein
VVPTGINDDGVIVGEGPISIAMGRGFKWDGLTLTIFEPFTDECPGCQLDTSAQAVNRRGEVAGRAEGNASYAVVFDVGNKARRLPDFGGELSVPTGLTSDGFTVGWAYRPDGSQRGWVYDGTQLIELGTLGGSRSDARGVNEHRQVIGCAAIEGNQSSQGFVYQDGQTTPLPRLADATACPSGINRHGHIVGYQRLPGSAETIGTLFMRGKLHDLNRMLLKSERTIWVITSAAAINGRGEIAATAKLRSTGYERAVVLVPVAP